jgi:hypothetical protein
MKFKVEIGGTSVLLDYKQLNAVMKALDGAERIEEKYVGSSQGTNNTNYLKLIRSYQPMDNFRFNGVSDDEYNALKLVTKLEDEKSANR